LRDIALPYRIVIHAIKVALSLFINHCWFYPWLHAILVVVVNIEKLEERVLRE